VLPYQNEAAIEEIPADVREDLQIVTVKTIGEVLSHTLEGTKAPGKRSSMRSPRKKKS